MAAAGSRPFPGTGLSYSVVTLAGFAGAAFARALSLGPRIAGARLDKNYLEIAGTAWRALTARKDGPSLYDVCDPLLLNGHGGDAHLCKFYRTALGNPPLRSLLRGAGLPELSDSARMGALQDAISQARDEAEPDWAGVGKPVAELLDSIALSHPKPAPAPVNGVLP